MPQERKTAQLLLYASILQEPLAALILLLPFLIIKELAAHTTHISALTALSPAVSILSFYWSSILDLKSSSLLIRNNLVLATCFTALPFLIAPFAYDPWYFVLAGTCYTLFFRAANPAKMELLKRKISSIQRERLYSRTFKVSYSIGMVLGPLLGILIDAYPFLWKTLFACAACFYLLSGWVYHLIPIDSLENLSASPPKKLGTILIDPWKSSYALLQKNRSFTYFQIGFFISGFGLMLAKPAGDWLLGHLDISYYSLFVCRTFLKGLGIIGTAKLWVKHLNVTNLLRYAHYVAWGFLLYNILLIGTHFSVPCVFVAYLIYGIAQSGSHLIWNLSGTLLSGAESSHQYSAVNVLAVGIRGCIAPVLGGVLLNLLGVIPTLGIGIGILFLGSGYLATRSQYRPSIEPLLPSNVT